MAVITLPGVITSFADTQVLDDLMRRFDNARRRTIIMFRACPNIGDEDQPASAELTFTGR
jgi:hypothetical protein